MFCCCYSVTQSCLTLCHPMDCSTPGFPVFHQLPEFAQFHVHWVGDAFQPSPPLSSPSPPALSLSQHQSFPVSQLFSLGGQSKTNKMCQVECMCIYMYIFSSPVFFPFSSIFFLFSASKSHDYHIQLVNHLLSSFWRVGMEQDILNISVQKRFELVMEAITIWVFVLTTE